VTTASFIHEAKDFSHLLGTLNGISDEQLKAHFGLYQGYVKKLNEIETKLQTIEPSGGNYSFNEHSELKRREAVAFNGAYLHQLYFENLTGKYRPPSGDIQSKIAQDFGSWDRFEAQVRGCATSTHGWVVASYSEIDKRVHLYTMIEHHIGLPVAQHILLALDCWEHAYMVDYSTAKAKYLDAFMANICWETVNKRLGLSLK
jgi:Fe-Mn family superoxide dismutase